MGPNEITIEELLKFVGGQLFFRWPMSHGEHALHAGEIAKIEQREEGGVALTFAWLARQTIMPSVGWHAVAPKALILEPLENASVRPMEKNAGYYVELSQHGQQRPYWLHRPNSHGSIDPPRL